MNHDIRTAERKYEKALLWLRDGTDSLGRTGTSQAPRAYKDVSTYWRYLAHCGRALQRALDEAHAIERRAKRIANAVVTNAFKPEAAQRHLTREQLSAIVQAAIIVALKNDDYRPTVGEEHHT